jgi:hypothetical protein
MSNLWHELLLGDNRAEVRARLDTVSAMALAMTCRDEVRPSRGPTRKRMSFVDLAVVSRHDALVTWAVDEAPYEESVLRSTRLLSWFAGRGALARVQDLVRRRSQDDTFAKLAAITTASTAAAARDHVCVVAWLMLKTAPKSFCATGDGYSAFLTAAEHGSLRTLRWLAKKMPRPYHIMVEQALAYAVRGDHVSAVYFLVTQTGVFYSAGSYDMMAHIAASHGRWVLMHWFLHRARKADPLALPRRAELLANILSSACRDDGAVIAAAQSLKPCPPTMTLADLLKFTGSDARHLNRTRVQWLADYCQWEDGTDDTRLGDDLLAWVVNPVLWRNDTIPDWRPLVDVLCAYGYGPALETVLLSLLPHVEQEQYDAVLHMVRAGK